MRGFIEFGATSKVKISACESEQKLLFRHRPHIGRFAVAQLAVGVHLAGFRIEIDARLVVLDHVALACLACSSPFRAGGPPRSPALSGFNAALDMRVRGMERLAECTENWPSVHRLEGRIPRVRTPNRC